MTRRSCCVKVSRRPLAALAVGWGSGSATSGRQGRTHRHFRFRIAESATVPRVEPCSESFGVGRPSGPARPGRYRLTGLSTLTRCFNGAGRLRLPVERAGLTSAFSGAQRRKGSRPLPGRSCGGPWQRASSRRVPGSDEAPSKGPKTQESVAASRQERRKFLDSRLTTPGARVRLAAHVNGNKVTRPPYVGHRMPLSRSSSAPSCARNAPTNPLRTVPCALCSRSERTVRGVTCGSPYGGLHHDDQRPTQAGAVRAGPDLRTPPALRKVSQDRVAVSGRPGAHGSLRTALHRQTGRASEGARRIRSLKNKEVLCTR